MIFKIVGTATSILTPIAQKPRRLAVAGVWLYPCAGQYGDGIVRTSS
jgi:hypothetical protein